MTNVWLKNKAVVWAMIVVFLFTSVFNTGISYAETAEAQTATVESVTVWNYDAEHSVTADMSEMIEDNTLDVIVPSDYVGCYIGVEVAVTGGIMYHDEECDEVLESPYSFSNFDWTEDNTGTVSFVVCTEDGVMDSYEITLHAIGDPISDPDDGDDSDGEDGDEVVDPDEGESDGNYGWDSYFNNIKVWSYEGLESICVDFSQMTDDGQLEVQIPTDYAGTEMTLDVSAGEGFVMWSEDGEDEFGGYNEFSLDGLTAGGSKTITFKIGEEGADEFKLCSITVSATINPYIEGIKVNHIGFAEDFDGVVELSEENVSEIVTLDLDVTEDNYDGEYLELRFTHVENSGTRSVTLYRDENGQFKNTFTVDRSNFEMEGSYKLKAIVDDCENKVQNLSEEPLTFEVKFNFSDNEAPAINDIYFTVDGVKCEEQGFKITEDQTVRVCADVSDNSSIKYIMVRYAIVYDDGYVQDSSRQLFADEETGLYSAEVYSDDNFHELYLKCIDAIDIYENYAQYKQVNGQRLQLMHYFKDNGTVAPEYTYNVELCIPTAYESQEVTTNRLTSFEDMGLEFDAPEFVEDAEFIGWKIGYEEDGEIVTSADQIFAIDGEELYLYPVYSKNIARVTAIYYNTDGDWVNEDFYFSFDEGVTYDELKELVKDCDYLNNLEHDSSQFLKDWYVYFEAVEGSEIARNFASFYAEASYRYQELVERTLYADGGVFADGSTEKTVIIDAEEEGHISKIEIPTRGGYAFGGWRDGDGCPVERVYDGCDNELHANWIDETNATIRYGEIQYIKNNIDEDDFEREYFTRDIWCDDGETTSNVTLPFDVNPDCVRLKVKKQDGTTVYEPIELEADGVTEYVYESVAADGVTTITYTVTITVEEPPTGLYYTELKYYNDGEYWYREFEFEENEATIALPYSFDSSREIKLIGKDIDGNWIETEGVVMGDSDEVTITYTSEVNGAVYTITVLREEARTNTGAEFCIRVYNDEDGNSYWFYSNEFDENNEFAITLPYGAVTEDSRIYLCAYPYDGASSDLPYDEDYEECRQLLTFDENGKCTTDVTITAENGNTRTYTINVSGSTDGSGTAISRLQYCWYWYDFDTDERRMVKADIDQDAAMSEDGVEIFMPVELIHKSHEVWIAGNSDNGSQFTWMSDGEEWTRTGSISEYFNIGEEDTEWEFSVTSPDGSTTETYRFTIKTVSIPDCAEHSFTNWIEYEDGMGEFCYCDVCGIHTSRPITGGEHEHSATGDWQYTDIEHWQVCECGQMLNADDHDYDEHVTKEATCSEPGEVLYECQCGYSYTEEIPTTDHQYTITVVEPTCTDNGYMIYTCECGDSYTGDFTPALDHDPVMMPIQEATCYQDGYEGGVECIRCHKVLEEPAWTPMIPCDYTGPWEVVEEPTCVTEGREVQRCHMCGGEISQAIPPNGIHIEEYFGGNPPTCTEPGTTEGVLCTVCHETLVWPEDIEPTGHEWGDWELIGENETPGYLDYERHCNNCDATESKTEEDPDYEGVQDFAALTVTDFTMDGEFADGNELSIDPETGYAVVDFTATVEYGDTWTAEPLNYIDAWFDCPELGSLIVTMYYNYETELYEAECRLYDDFQLGLYSLIGFKTGDERELNTSVTGDYTFVLTHEHDFSGNVNYDETGHWVECECGETSEVMEHVYYEEIDSDPTCTEYGRSTFYCEDCDYSYTVETEPADHEFAEELSYDENSHWKVCINCEEAYDANEHDWGEWEVVSSYDDYIEYERGCRYCAAVEYKTEEDPEDPGDEHECTPAGDWVYDDNQHWHVCDCLEILDIENHQIVLADEIEATCIEPGERIFGCETCDYSYIEYTPTSDHEWSDWVLVDSFEGNFDYERYCDNCSEIEFKTIHINHPEVVLLYYFTGDEEKYKKVDLDDDFVSTVEIPYSYNKEKGVVLEWRDTDGTKKENPVTWNEDGTGCVEIESCNGYSYTINVNVAEAASNTDCSLSLGNSKGNSYAVDADAAGTDEGATVILPEGAIDGLFMRIITCENGYVEGLDYIVEDYVSYYKMNLTPDKNGEINIEFTLIAENGEDTQTYKVKVMEEQKAPEVHEHKYFSSVTKPTCTGQGYTTYTCACGDSYVADYTKATGHVNTETIKGKAATCTATGLTDTEKCLDCGLILEPQQVIKALGHDWDKDWTIDDDATCTAAGKQHKDCSRCDEKQTGSIPATGHSYDEEVTDPTCTEGGYTTYTCGECGHSYVGAQTGAAGHEWDEWYEDDSDCLGTSYFRMCDSCGAEETKFEEGEGHDYETFTKVITKASAKAAGKIGTYQYCNTCQDEDEAERISTETLPKLAAVKMSATALTYSGKKAIPTLTVKDTAGKELVKGTDYKVTIKNSAGKVVSAPKAVGKYKITITYMGNYKGSTLKNYTINPAGTTLGKLTGGNKQITVKWTKKTAQVTGYQIRYSTKQNMNGAKTVTVTKAKTTSRVIKKLTAKKKYYVQIRTYKTVNGKKYFSAWSAKKNVKTK